MTVRLLLFHRNPVSSRYICSHPTVPCIYSFYQKSHRILTYTDYCTALRYEALSTMKNFIATLSSVLALEIATTNAGRQFYHVHGGLDKRQTTSTCYGDNCADACGQDYISCWSSDYCFNPSAGETCCANGDGSEY
jgi:hypothetical protein